MDIARAWRDTEYRASLTAAQQAELPEHPAGAVELDDEELAGLAGGTGVVCGAVTVSLCVSGMVGCLTINNSLCNGTCAFNTSGCCG
jgi:mersacidin/lichenicidin family type 2 lantibiotic